MSNPYIADAVARRVERNRSHIPDVSSFIANPTLLDKRRTDAAITAKLWTGIVPVTAPDNTQFFDWVEKFGALLLEKAIRRTAEKTRKRARTGDPMSPDDAHRYCSATLRNMAQQGR